MTENKRKTGSSYEDIAAVFLRQRGYEILYRNYYGRHGEIDIIASENNYLVFIEVKFRQNTNKGLPEEAVSYRKRLNIINTAREYIYKNHISWDIPMRFDIVSILGERISIIKNAFEI